MYEKSRFKVSTYQNEIDLREEEINRLKRQMSQKDEDIKMQDMKLNQMSERMADIEDELEMKSGENNRLRTQVAELEKTVQDLYVSRKGDGSYQVELDTLKADNERLIKLLKSTTEVSFILLIRYSTKTCQNQAFWKSPKVVPQSTVTNPKTQ